MPLMDDRSTRSAKRRTTMQDIARMAEVDISTVSRALADSPRVTEETKKRIRQIVEETGYAVNHGARMLRHSRSGQILVMLPNIAATFFPEVVLGIEDAVQEHGFNVVVGSTRSDIEREDGLARQLLTGAADGVILMTGILPEALRSFPDYDRHIVGVSRTILEDGIAQVNIDNGAAMETAVGHFLALGHHRIAHLGGPQSSPTFRARADAYKSVMQSAGLHDHIRLLPWERFNIQAGTEAMRELLKQSPRPTAVICASDEMAMGAMEVVRAEGLSIPADIAFMGFDDISFSAVFNPSLSTIHIPRREMGLIGARMLLENMDLTKEKPRDVVMEHKLMVRESSGSRLQARSG